MKVENGKNVSVHYTLKLEDGTVVDSSVGREPLKTVIGQGQLIPGFEKGLVGMEVGEKKNIEVEPDEGYGERYDGLVTTVSPEQVPPGVKVGDVLQSSGERGVMNVTITNITEEGITIDANHPMSGKKLYFEVEVMGIG